MVIGKDVPRAHSHVAETVAPENVSVRRRGRQLQTLGLRSIYCRAYFDVVASGKGSIPSGPFNDCTSNCGGLSGYSSCLSTIGTKLSNQ